MNATEKARADAQAAAQRTLQRAATFAELHATSKPLFQKPMRLGSRSVLVRIVWPGVLVVCDPGTGEVLAALLELAATGLNAREVGHPCMDDAITLGWLLVPHAQAAFALLGSDQVDVDADAVLRWARGRGEAVFLRSECHQAMSGRFRDVERLKKALDRLEVNHVLQGFVVREKGKKPSQRYRINPACLLSS